MSICEVITLVLPFSCKTRIDIIDLNVIKIRRGEQCCWLNLKVSFPPSLSTQEPSAPARAALTPGARDGRGRVCFFFLPFF